MREYVVRCAVREDQTIPAAAGSGNRPSAGGVPRSRRWPKVVGVTLVSFVVACALIAAVAPLLQPTSPVIGNDIRKVAAAIGLVLKHLKPLTEKSR